MRHRNRQRRSLSSVARSLGTGVLAAAVLASVVLPAPAEAVGDPMQIGFTSNIFRNRNENDTLAAMKVWAQTLSEERGLELLPDMTMFRSCDLAADALRAGDIDALTMLLGEYAEIPEGLLSGPFFRNATNGSIHERFVLLGSRDGAVKDIASLRGSTLMIYDDPDALLAEEWLEAECAQAGLGPLRSEVARLERNENLSAAVLGVFFGTSDACLVGEAGFDSMVELNPQVASKLEVVARSAPMVPSVFGFRASLPEEQKMTLFREVRLLHETVTGEQVLRVFKTDRMGEVTEEEMKNSADLLRQWRQAAESRDELTSAQTGGKP